MMPSQTYHQTSTATMNSSSNSNTATTTTQATAADVKRSILDESKRLADASGDSFNGWRDGLINITRAPIFSEPTLADIEERALPSIRPRPERILAQEYEHIEMETIHDVITHEMMFVKWRGKSILRATWEDADLWKELQPGGKVREDWERTGGRGFDMKAWHGAVQMDEDLRCERRFLALLRRQIMEVVGPLLAEAEDEDVEIPEGMEILIRREEQQQRREREELHNTTKN